MANMDIYAPFDDGPGANVTEDTWRRMMRHINGSASGVVRGFLDEFEVYADDSGMQVKVKTGECLMRGHFGATDEEKTLPIAPADPEDDRIDRVVIRADFLNNVIGLEVLTGTPASSPAPPVLTQSSTIWETTLAQVYVPAGDGSIEDDQVTDERMFTSCHAKYLRRDVDADQSIITNRFKRLAAARVDYQTAEIVASNVEGFGFDTFTLNRAGLWTISARVIWAQETVSNPPAHYRDLRIIDPSDLDDVNGASLIYGALTVPHSGGNYTHMSVAATERFPAGKQISATAWHSAGSSRDILAFDITFTWVGP